MEPELLTFSCLKQLAKWHLGKKEALVCMQHVLEAVLCCWVFGGVSFSLYVYIVALYLHYGGKIFSNVRLFVGGFV